MSYGHPQYPQHPPHYPPPGYPFYHQPYMPPRPPQPELPPALRTAKIVLVVLMPLLWVIALALPAYDDEMYGAVALIFGWMLLGTNFFGFLAWFANLLFLPGYFIFAIGKKRGTRLAALILGLVAFVFSLGALFVDEVPDWSGTESVDVSIGAYVWIVSLFLLPVAGAIFLFAQPQAAPAQQPPQYVDYSQQYPQYPNYPQQNYPQPNYPSQNDPPRDPYANYLPPNYPPIPENPEQPHNPW